MLRVVLRRSACVHALELMRPAPCFPMRLTALLRVVICIIFSKWIDTPANGVTLIRHGFGLIPTMAGPFDMQVLFLFLLLLIAVFLALSRQIALP